MRGGRITSALGPGLVLLAAAAAHADRAEWRFELGGGAAALMSKQGGANGGALAVTGYGRFAYGITDAFDIAVVSTYARGADVEFDFATIDGQKGRLFADLTSCGVLVELRWTLGVGVSRAFERTRPYVAVRAGGALLLVDSQELFDASERTLATPGDSARVAGAVGAAIGLEHRFGDRLTLTGDLDVLVHGDVKHGGFTFSLGWSWY